MQPRAAIQSRDEVQRIDQPAQRQRRGKKKAPTIYGLAWDGRGVPGATGGATCMHAPHTHVTLYDTTSTAALCV